MWIKRKHYAINLDDITWFGVKERAYERWALAFFYKDDSERLIDYNSKEEAEEAFNVIVHALGTEICVLD